MAAGRHLRQRGKNRPDRIGLTICQVLKVEGTTLQLKGLDAIDGTPVLDLKPWMSGFAPRGVDSRTAMGARTHVRLLVSPRSSSTDAASRLLRMSATVGRCP